MACSLPKGETREGAEGHHKQSLELHALYSWKARYDRGVGLLTGEQPARDELLVTISITALSALSSLAVSL